MTNDLIERLRKRPLISNEDDITEWAKRMDEAADALAQCRAELRLQDDANDILTRDKDALRAEVERLKGPLHSPERYDEIAALRARVAEVEGVLEKIVRGDTGLDSSRQFARAALERKP